MFVWMACVLNAVFEAFIKRMNTFSLKEYLCKSVLNIVIIIGKRREKNNNNKKI